jgi:MoaA/NifB/PqqE/SkfB family radical SAM enzyme
MGITERIDAITRIDPRYRGTVLPAPRSVKIEITASCNYRCAFCVKSLRADNGEMDRAFYSRILREMRDAGVEELGVFYIGESFTCKWLPEAIAECMAAGLDSLKFSLNFTDDAQFAEIAQVSPKLYRRALENLKAARVVRDAGKFKCGLYASSIAFDGEQGEKMRAVVEEILPFVDQHYWLPLYGWNSEAFQSVRAAHLQKDVRGTACAECAAA